MDLHSVLIEPITTEKSTMLQDKATYVFKINKHATKIDVKKAIKLIYGGEVDTVRITRTQPKSRYVGRNLFLKRRMGKKAVFKMKDGKTIDITKFVDKKKSKPKKK
ncbi:50S ribosomal protein L23 [Patescibacteria group bacterium]